MKRAGSSTVSLNRCAAYDIDVLRRVILEGLAPFGGMSAFVSSGDRVLLKPNLLSAKDPSRAITTHPHIVETVAALVREAGGEPFVGDSPGGAIRGIERVWENTLMSEMAERAGLELVNFEASGSEEIDAGKYRLYIARPVIEADVVINLPKLKTHTLTLLTGAVKNMFGVIPGFRKAEMHKIFPKPSEFAAMLVELYSHVKPSVNIMDAVLSMEGNGPSSGVPRETGLIAVSDDAVALDAVISGVIGFQPEKIDTTRIAGERGLGVSERQSIEVTGDAAGTVIEDYDLPSNLGIRLIPGPLARMVAPLVWLKLVIDEDRCTGCEMCYKSCPVKTIVPDGEIFRVVHDGCVQCMCCHELCPENAVEIKLSWLARKWS
ncbi:MAG: DUF362 domain-containing protein [Candidatus Krumholzibacteria bacterium]|nr:DUF362 domain-containing protein [Candidatus Krumholzibacteria bacterium]